MLHQWYGIEFGRLIQSGVDGDPSSIKLTTEIEKLLAQVPCRCRVDRYYTATDGALDQLAQQRGLVAAWINHDGIQQTRYAIRTIIILM